MLYVVATPIGNLDDLSIRQARILNNVDIIFAEDTRSAFKLLDGIKARFRLKRNKNQKIISFYKENEYNQTFKCLTELKEGKNIALISEAGMPLISDPGEQLIKEVIKKNLDFTVIPGATALTTALIHSGFAGSNFMFMGFAPKKPSQQRKFINKLIEINKVESNMTFVIYVSMYQYIGILGVMDEVMPNVDIVVCREMTKKFEEIIRGKPKDLMNRKFKGEITLVIKM